MDSENDPRHCELDAISSIYPEIQLKPNFTFTLVLVPKPSSPWKVRFPGAEAHTIPSTFKYLPEITLEVVLPDGYPEAAPPKLNVSSEWLPGEAMKGLEEDAERLWESNGRSESVYDIIDQVLQGIDSGFGLFGSNGEWKAPNSLKELLVSWNKQKMREEFENGTYVCEICLDPCKGTACHKFTHCGHIFCISCLQDMYKTAIRTGDIAMVRCPSHECSKPKKKARAPPPAATAPTDSRPNGTEIMPLREPPMPPTLSPYELKFIGITPDYINRYLFMKRKIYLDADPTTTICPREWCQAHSRSAIELHDTLLRAGMLGEYFVGENPTVSPLSLPSAAERAKQKLDICSKCSFAFCRICEHSWHGDKIICRGKNYVKTDQEIKDEQYIESISTFCPGCESPVLKSEGCNHISCKCGIHFCFLCGAYLNADSPYVHYNTKGKWCYMKLWEGEDVGGG